MTRLDINVVAIGRQRKCRIAHISAGQHADKGIRGGVSEGSGAARIRLRGGQEGSPGDPSRGDPRLPSSRPMRAVNLSRYSNHSRQMATIKSEATGSLLFDANLPI